MSRSGASFLHSLRNKLRHARSSIFWDPEENPEAHWGQIPLEFHPVRPKASGCQLPHIAEPVPFTQPILETTADAPSVTSPHRVWSLRSFRRRSQSSSEAAVVVDDDDEHPRRRSFKRSLRQIRRLRREKDVEEGVRRSRPLGPIPEAGLSVTGELDPRRLSVNIACALPPDYLERPPGYSDDMREYPSPQPVVSTGHGRSPVACLYLPPFLAAQEPPDLRHTRPHQHLREAYVQSEHDAGRGSIAQLRRPGPALRPRRKPLPSQCHILPPCGPGDESREDEGEQRRIVTTVGAEPEPFGFPSSRALALPLPLPPLVEELPFPLDKLSTNELATAGSPRDRDLYFDLDLDLGLNQGGPPHVWPKTATTTTTTKPHIPQLQLEPPSPSLSAPTSPSYAPSPVVSPISTLDREYLSFMERYQRQQDRREQERWRRRRP